MLSEFPIKPKNSGLQTVNIIICLCVNISMAVLTLSSVFIYSYISTLRAHPRPTELEHPGLEPEKCTLWRFLSDFVASVF